jgi:hypothetical protein
MKCLPCAVVQSRGGLKKCLTRAPGWTPIFALERMSTVMSRQSTYICQLKTKFLPFSFPHGEEGIFGSLNGLINVVKDIIYLRKRMSLLCAPVFSVNCAQFFRAVFLSPIE